MSISSADIFGGCKKKRGNWNVHFAFLLILQSFLSQEMGSQLSLSRWESFANIYNGEEINIQRKFEFRSHSNINSKRLNIFFWKLLEIRSQILLQFFPWFSRHRLRTERYPYSTVILKEYFENIPLKSCNIAKIFIKLLERFLKYCRNLAMSVQNSINGILLQY